MPQFASTIKHIKEGVKSVTISQATKNIEGWQATLEKVEAPGAENIVKDLEKLKEQLHADELNGEAIRKLVAKLGKATVAIGKKAEGDKAGQIQELGQALADAATETGDEDDDEEEEEEDGK